MEMRFRFLDPNDEKQKPTMPFVLDFNDGETKGEADSPAGLVALVVGPEYADVEDEEVAWHVRTEAMEGHALWLAALGSAAVVVDGSVPEPVFDPYGGGRSPDVELRVDSDWAMIASLHNAGLVTLYEREDVSVFRGGAAPASCRECAYYSEAEKVCRQFDAALESDANGCLDGAALPKEAVGDRKGKRRYVQVGRIEIPPARVKASRHLGLVS